MMMSAAEPPRNLERTDVIRWRRRSRIPHDQQTILDSPSSWAVDLQGKPYGAAQIPAHVLQTVKDAHVRRTAKPSIVTNPPAAAASCTQATSQAISQAPAPAPAPAPFEAVSQAIEIDFDLEDEDEHEHELPTSTFDENAPPTSEFSWEASPPRSEPRRRPSPPSTTIFAAPSSYQNGASTAGDDADEMEVELPQAQHIISRRDVPVKDLRSAPAPAPRIDPAQARARPSSISPPLLTRLQTAPTTPPCGQGEREQAILREAVQSARTCTSTKPDIASASASARRSSPAKTSRPTRRMKPVEFPEENKQQQQQDEQERRGHREQGHEQPPQRSAGRARTASMPSPQVVNAVEILSSQQGNGWDEESDDDDADEMASSSIVPATIREMNTSTLPSFADHSESLAPEADMAPYEIFTSVYPDYTTKHLGTLWKFVQACVYLRDLQKRKEAREYWYDDIIQAYCGFIRYAQNSGPGHDPVSAIEWYCGIRGPMLYDRMVVRRENLDLILSYYPSEVAKAEQIINSEKETRLPHAGGHSRPPRTSDQQRRRSTSIFAPKLPSPQHRAHSRPPVPRIEPRPRSRAISPELGSDPMEIASSQREPAQSQMQPIQSPEVELPHHQGVPSPTRLPSTTHSPQPTPSQPAQRIETPRPRLEPPQQLLPPPPPPPPPPKSSQASTPSLTPLHISSSAVTSTHESAKRSLQPDEPSSSARSLKKRKVRSSAERQRLFEHFRKGTPSSSGVKL